MEAITRPARALRDGVCLSGSSSTAHSPMAPRCESVPHAAVLGAARGVQAPTCPRWIMPLPCVSELH